MNLLRINKSSLNICWLSRVTAIGLMSIVVGTAHALPALQLGPGTGDWTWDNETETWVATDFWSTDDNPFTVNAYANAMKADGGHEKYAWVSTGAADQYAYLFFAATPDIGNTVLGKMLSRVKN